MTTTFDTRFANVVSTAPAFEPIGLVEAKEFCRIDGPDEDTLINSYITAARIHASNINGRQMARATYTLTMDRFPTEIVLPRPPLSTVTTIKYYDVNGTQQTLANTVYQVHTNYEPGRVVLAPDQSWPSIQSRLDAVEVIYVTGFADAASVPEVFKQAMRMLINHWYEHREPVAAGYSVQSIPMTVDTLLLSDRIQPASQG